VPKEKILTNFKPKLSKQKPKATTKNEAPGAEETTKLPMLYGKNEKWGKG